MDDSKYVTLCQQGDPSAFAYLFETYKQEALRTACMITGNYALSEDIVQEAFLTAYRKIQKLKDPVKFKSWFFQILTRIAWRSCQRQAREIPSDDIFQHQPLRTQESSLETCIQSETSRMLLHEIQKLDEKQRTVIILYYYNQLSIKEIAKITGCLEGTVKSRLHAARKNLKNGLSDHDQNEGGRNNVSYYTI